MSLSIEKGHIKKFRSDSYNYNFDVRTGYFERWGKTKEDDPIYSPFGPEIWDAEVSEQCNGVNNKPCSFCYKSNVGSRGRNMTFDEFVTVFDKLPKYDGIPFLTQIAFGIGNIDANPDLWKMMEYCIANTVIPNITINGDRLTDNIVNKLSTLCGAISVSCYEDHDVCYNAVKRLKDVGCKQVNIHQMISEETFKKTVNLLNDASNDSRLKNLNAVVMLSLKQKGRGESFTPLSSQHFKMLITVATARNVPFGFDSCGANKVIEVAKEIGKYDEWNEMIEPCESTAFSFYTNVEGKFFPCSFAEDVTTGIDMIEVKDFNTDVWENKLTCVERKRIIDNGRNCPYFEV